MPRRISASETDCSELGQRIQPCDGPMAETPQLNSASSSLPRADRGRYPGSPGPSPSLSKIQNSRGNKSIFRSPRLTARSTGSSSSGPTRTVVSRDFTGRRSDASVLATSSLGPVPMRLWRQLVAPRAAAPGVYDSVPVHRRVSRIHRFMRPETLTSTPRLKWVAETVPGSASGTVTASDPRGPEAGASSSRRSHSFPRYDGQP